MTTCFVLIRAAHMTACLLAFGLCVFDRLVARGPIALVGQQGRRIWRKIAGSLLWIALPLALLSGLAWFAMVAIAMTDLPVREALGCQNLSAVLNQTQFGTLWKLRTAIWLAVALVAPAAFLASAPRLRNAMSITALLLSGALAGSLAWAGHGQTGAWAAWHLIADVLHLLASGCWPIGLLPLLMFLMALRRESDPVKWPAISVLVRRFSIMSLTCVALLVATGLVNSWLLVGSVARLFDTAYGRTLLAKIGVFLLMVIAGAINLLYLKPRICVEPLNERAASIASATRRLRQNVALELGLAAAVMIVVGLLGLLQPGVE